MFKPEAKTGCAVAVLIWIAIMILSYLATAGLVWVVCWGFGWTWSWKIALAVWAAWFLLHGIVSHKK